MSLIPLVEDCFLGGAGGLPSSWGRQTAAAVRAPLVGDKAQLPFGLGLGERWPWCRQDAGGQPALEEPAAGTFFALSTRRSHSASIGVMYALPKPGYDPEAMRAVAVAYRRERQAGRLDQPAREAAIATFRARLPEIERLPASAAVAHIVAWAAREYPAWFWRGVGLPERQVSPAFKR